MPLQKQIVEIPLTGGLDTKTDPKLVQPGSFLAIENGIYIEAMKTKKRNGYAQLGNAIQGQGTILTSGKRLGVYNNGSLNNELLQFSNNTLYTYNQSGNNWISKGELVGATVSEQTIFRNTYQQTQVDMDSSGGITVYAWNDSRGGVRCSVFDENENAIILNDTLINSNGSAPHVIFCGAQFFIFHIDGTNIKYVTITMGAPNIVSSLTTLISDLTADKTYDVSLFGSNMALAYAQTGNNVKLIAINNQGTVSATGLPAPVVVAERALNCLGIFVDNQSRVFVAYHNTTNGVRCFGVNSSFVSLFGATTLDSDIAKNYVNITGATSNNTTNAVRWYYEQSNAATYNQLIKTNTITYAGTAGSTSVFMRSVGLVSKAFNVGTACFFHIVFSSTLQSTYFTASESGKVFSRIIPGLAAGLTNGPYLPKITNISTNNYIFPNSIVTKISTQNNVNYTVKGVNRTMLNFGSDSLYQTLQSGLALHIIAGMLWNYDGATLAEHSFHVYPENCTTAQTTGGNIADATYLYNIVYAWTSAKGEIHRSFPFSVTQIVTGGSGTAKVNVTIPTLRITQKTNVIIEVYRTQGNGTIPYKLTSISSSTFNDPTVDSIVYADSAADNTINTNEILYTVGGVVGNICPPSCSFGLVHQNRVILKVENQNQLWYSKFQQQGFGLGFSDLFTFQIDPTGMDVSNLGSLDSNLIILKRFLLRGIAGNGPNDTGTNSDFTLDQKINSDAGSSQIRGIVSTDTGLIYKSDKGFYRLNRSLTVDYLGWPVEAYNGQTVTSAVLVPNTNQVRFTTRNGPCLVYDYFFDKWTTFTNHIAEDAVIWNNQYTYLQANGTVNVETIGSFLDGTKQIVLKIGLPWIKLANIQGFQRAYRAIILGDFKSNHQLQVNIYYDYQNNPIYTTFWQPNSVINTNLYGSESPFGSLSPFGGPVDNIYQFMVHNPIQKCESIRYEFLDVPDPTTNGESYALSSLNLYVGIKQGLNKVRAQKQIG